ncbi:PLXNB [Mytilus coruscus]|uniref:PLXNB n=1 Tax=Mytilus coruscus TaxID=42192 RepID=A0A6J8BVY1_MYTCO|nr:PLXNB [Mytilus coruscus]
MSGFRLYVTNTSTISPDSYLCYEDRYSIRPPFPNTTQKIPCNQLGRYVVYYDKKGSDEETHVYEAIVELCYVAINGCPKTFWGNNCKLSCPESCIEQHCFPGNGSCIWGGCSDENCLQRNCDKDSAICYDGCKENRTGPFCNKYNIAFNSLILLHSNVDEQTSLVSDGNNTSCITTQGSDIWVQVDIKEISIVTEIYLKLSVIINSTNTGNHTIYTSNSSALSEYGTVLYSGQSIPSAIKVTTLFRYLIYVPPIYDKSSLEICEIGIVGCPLTYYTPFCNKMCPVNCRGPCDIETGTCKFGCSSGWIGDTCDIDADCVINPGTSSVICMPKIYKVFPSSGPVNGGTLLTITGKYIGNVNDSLYVEVSGKPTILDFSPKKGIISGGTTLSIRGVDIGFEGQNRYKISFCDNEICIECSACPNAFSSAFISCKTGKSGKPRNMTLLLVVIDDLTVVTHNDTFLYLPDPKFDISNQSQKSLQSGGPFTILDEGFGIVGEITVRGMGEICHVQTDTYAVCEIPAKKQNEAYTQTLFVHFDGVILQFTLEYVDDPTFEQFQSVLEYDKESTIQIKGKHILNVARREDYSVHIGLDGKCIITDIDMISITCLPPTSVPRPITRINDDKPDHIEEDEMIYCEINPDDELQSITNKNIHQDVTDGYADLAHRSAKDPYNRLHEESADNPIRDMTTVDDRTEDLSASEPKIIG